MGDDQKQDGGHASDDGQREAMAIAKPSDPLVAHHKRFDGRENF
jgi:hypothetical protein